MPGDDLGTWGSLQYAAVNISRDLDVFPALLTARVNNGSFLFTVGQGPIQKGTGRREGRLELCSSGPLFIVFFIVFWVFFWVGLCCFFFMFKSFIEFTRYNCHCQLGQTSELFHLI